LLNKPFDTSADLSSLRVMTCSTAPLSTRQWLRFEQTRGIRLLNLYGSSEAGWICGNRPQARKLGTVGYPVRHITFTILDNAGLPCQPNQPGHVFVQGGKLALGLLRADGSLEPLRTQPLAMRDLATQDEEGFVRIYGRTDDLIIRGGIKIMPQEIEEILLGHEGIQDAAAIGVPDPIYGQESVCFIVQKSAGGLNEAAVLAYCEMNLPRGKMPRRVFIVNSLPRSDRGKILRDVLRREWWTSDAGQAAGGPYLESDD
jgi:acyl-coenzyme A synthetase/AMP-(fatty) acid ligase